MTRRHATRLSALCGVLCLALSVLPAIPRIDLDLLAKTGRRPAEAQLPSGIRHAAVAAGGEHRVERPGHRPAGHALDFDAPARRAAADRVRGRILAAATSPRAHWTPEVACARPPPPAIS